MGDKDRVSKNKIAVNFSMKDVPVGLYRWFVSDIKQYNDCYWAKLMDIQRKAQAYDMFVNLGVIPQEQQTVDEDEEDKIEKGEEVNTFGGKVE